MAIGRHGLQGKQNLYEHTWRVPMVVTGPGIKPGTRATGNTYLLDLLATFCDVTGVPAPSSNEGTSFKPVLTGEKDAVRETLYGVYRGGGKPGIRAVKKGDWKLLKYDSPSTNTQETQLFNLAENPHEFIAESHHAKVTDLTGVTPTSAQTNLAADPKYKEKLAEMEALLLEQMRDLNDPHRLWNQPDDGLKAPQQKTKGPKKKKNK
jgi:arylsulfatase A-like enzyme